jgi:Cu-Zn family superoxide dismutase
MLPSTYHLQAVICLLAVASWSCASGGGESCAELACVPAPLQAAGTLQPKPGTAISGTVALVEEAGAITVRVEVKGAAPGQHGVHLHETGDCSAPDFSSAGGHFNPAGAAHACPPTVPRHAGDFGNITIGPDGSGRLQLSTDLISLAPGAKSAVGRALILHDEVDDCTSQPVGKAGMREACAVIALP